MGENEWMVVKNGAQLESKYSIQDVRNMVQNSPPGTIFVWKEGLSQWADPNTLPDFQAPPPEEATQRGIPVVPDQPPAPAAPDISTKPEPSQKFKEGGKAILEGAAAQLGRIRDAETTHAYLPHLKILDKCLELARKFLSQNLLDKVDDWAKKFGNIGLLVAALFYFIGTAIFGIKNNNFISTPGMGLIFVLVLLLAQYVAIKFLDAGQTLIAKSPSRLSSNAILECVALLALLGAIATLGGGIFMAIGSKQIVVLLGGLGASLVLLYLAGVALNSGAVNVNVAGDAGAGEEAIGLYAFILKILLRLVPFAYGVAMVGFAFLIAYTAVTLPFKEEFADIRAFSQLTAMSTQVLMAAIMPFVIYVAVLFLYLSIDVVRAILVIPGKLDRQNRSLED